MMFDNLAYVSMWFDDEQTMPADYVLRWSDDYEAFVAEVTHKVDDIEHVDQLSLGHYRTLEQAAKVIREWRRPAHANPFDPFDFNEPTRH